MNAINFTIYPENINQIEAIKAMFKAFNIKFKTENQEYNPDFVERVITAKKEIKQGKGIKINPDDLWK